MKIIPALIVSLFLFFNQPALAQMSGNRATELAVPETLIPLTVEQVNSHIAIEGTCQKRITPTSIRLIWAVTAEDAEPEACRQQTAVKIKTLTERLKAMDIENENTFEDFISVIPRFDWIVEDGDGEQMLVEKQTGFRMQTNLHIAVKTNEQAMQVVDAALASGLTDLIGVDYAAELAEAQDQARAGAVEAAKNKSRILLAAVFDETPKAINVQEKTSTSFPDQMYSSFENVASNNLTIRYDDRRNRISAYRPRNTFYAGQTRAADEKSYALPMKPEIIVESKVVIYYQSPSEKAIDD